MRPIIILFFLIFTSLTSNSQKSEIQIIGGRSVNGTGDIRGSGFSVDYGKYFKKKLRWSVSIGSTIHDGEFPIFYEYPAGNMVDGSIRYTTAGFQGIFGIGYNFLNSHSHEFIFKLGGLVRYQSTSYYDNVVVLYPLLTNLPFPVIIFRNRTPQKSFAVGAIPQISYNYSLSRKFSIGILAAYQFDTNGDNISQLSLSLGRKF